MPDRTVPRCGFVAIVGRPNVGKSTLLNHLVQQKISITSRKPQTTRHNILGIRSADAGQIVYVDTPGMHSDEKGAMNRYMNRSAVHALGDIDAVLFVVEALKWTVMDDAILQKLNHINAPVILVVNKVDRVKNKTELLPWLKESEGKGVFSSVVPVSALKGTQLDVIEAQLIELLPCGEPMFPQDQVTDRSERFLAAEIVREKLTRALGQELPYALTVEIESYEVQKDIVHIGAIVWVERKSQKSIVIGEGGKNLKKIGVSARFDIEKLVGKRVNLKMWVKTKEGWSNNERSLKSLGYREYP